MTKQRKISYKLFYNKRLKQTDFHGKVMSPLYLQLIYARQPLYFKSYYFDFLSQEKFSVNVGGVKVAPSIEIVESMEKSLMDYIIEHHSEDFSIESFYTLYEYYARDLLTLLEDSFFQYLDVFFQDEGVPIFGSLCRQAKGRDHAGLLMQDLKQILSPSSYKKLIAHAVHYGSPYIPLYNFAKKISGDAAPVLLLKDWKQPGVQATFREYMDAYYSEYDYKAVCREIDALIGVGR